MPFTAGVHKQVQEGPIVGFHCLYCQQPTAGTSFEQCETLMWFHVIPTYRHRTTFVQCGTCGETMLCSLRVADLEQYDGLEVTQFLSRFTPLVHRVLAIVSALLFWTPLVGFALAALTVFLTRGKTGWTRKVALVSLALSGFFTTLLVVIPLLLGKL